jgi:RNA polymerase sigma-70 factor (ECF subfamily)
MHNVISTAVASPVGIDETSAVTDSIETLAHRHYAELLRVLRARLPNEQDAADLAQESYARLLRYEGRYNGEELRRILFRIASNLLTDHWRWSRLRDATTHLPIDDLELDSGEPSEDRKLAAEQRLARLEKVVLAMPEKRRAAFILSRIQGLTNAEVARRCGISVKTVEKHLSLALAECRAQAGDDDLGSL